MAEPLSILFLPSWYPSRNHATMGNFVRRHAKAASLKNRVAVVAAIISEQEDLEISEEGNLLEIKVYFKKKFPISSYKKAMRRGIVEAERRFEKFDLAHVNVTWPAGLLALSLKIPFVITEHFSGYQESSDFKYGLFRKKMVLKILNSSKKILPVSEHLGKAIRRFGAKTEIAQLSNVVDTSIFNPAKNQNEKFVFLHISTLEERSKNITGILNGFKLLLEKSDDFLLKIGGDGNLEILKQKIIKVQIPDRNIEIFGEKSQVEIASLMQNADALVMFSHFENQPCTILEALCCGIPVVSSDVGGIAEVLDEKSGILVEPENQQRFVEALSDVMENHNRFDKHEIAEKARLSFSYETISEEMNSLYRGVLKK